MIRQKARLELYIPRHDRPGNARNLVCESDRNEFESFFPQQGSRPLRQWGLGLAILHLVKHSICPNDKKLSHSSVTYFGNEASLGFTPVECCLGTRPNQAANSRRHSNSFASGTLAERQVAMTGPIPGIVESRRLTSSLRCAARIALSSFAICPLISITLSLAV